MAYYQIQNIGALGVIADVAPTDLPPNGFTDAINARFVNGKVTKFGGNKKMSFQEEDQSITPLSLLPVPFDAFSGGTPFNITGTQDGLYQFDDQRWKKLSRWVAFDQGMTTTKDFTVFPRLRGLTFGTSSEIVKTQQSITITVATVPDNVQTARIKWAIDNPLIGTFTPNPDNQFEATFKAGDLLGNAIITATSEDDDSITAFVALTIVENVNKIYLDQDSYSLTSNESKNVFVTIDSSQSITGGITWISSDPTVATVTQDSSDPTKAVLQAVRIGSATISAFLTESPTIKTTSSVSVKSGVNYIILNRYSLSTKQDTTTDKLTVSFVPSNAPDQGVEWTVPTGESLVTLSISSDTKTANLSYNGVGEVVIRATAKDGQTAIAECRITVAPASMALMARSLLAANVLITSVEITTVDNQTTLNVGEKLVLTAQVNGGSNPPTNPILYRWVVKKSGVIVYDKIDGKTLTIQGAQGGEVTVQVSVFDTEQEVYNVTPDNTWWHAIVANCAVANVKTHSPMVKEYDSESFIELPGWGEQTEVDDNGNWSIAKYNWRCERVRAFNNRLFALNMTESNQSGAQIHYPLRVRWSNFATENKAPTLWDDYAYLRDAENQNDAEGTLEALVNGYSGYIDLADSNGNILDMLPLKDYLFVYTEFETYMATPTMNSYQPMTFKKLFNDSGILAPGCVVETEMGHFVVTQNDIILHSGASKKSLAASRVRSKIINEIMTINPLATRVHLHQDKNEVWILYVGKGAQKNSWACTKAAVWNFEFDTWTFCDIPHSYCIALVDPPTVDKSALWSDFAEDGKLPMRWSDVAASRRQWQPNFSNFHKRVTLVGSRLKGFYQVDEGPFNHVMLNQSSVDPEQFEVREIPLKMVATRSGIDFDNATMEWNQKHVNRYTPQVTGNGTLSFVAGGTQYPNEFGHAHTIRDFIIGKDRHVNVRLNHPYLYYQIIDEDIDSSASVNSMIIDYVVGGRR